MEAVSPRNESVPYSLYTSRRSPEAAEEENIFTIASGTSSPGNPIYAVNRPRRPARKSRNPEARRMPTAVIRPIKVGRIRITVRKPLFCPLHKSIIYRYFHQNSVTDNQKNNKRDDKIREKEKYIHTLHLPHVIFHDIKGAGPTFSTAS